MLFVWIGLVRYLDIAFRGNLVEKTMRKIYSEILVFLVGGFLPIFLSFVVLGTALFWKYDFFCSFTDSTITLFAIFGGDIVNDTVNQLSGFNLFGWLYLIVYLLVFYSTVQTVLVSIVI